MPELPEVETTAKILNNLVKGQKILAVWTDYDSPYFYGKNNIKDPKYFKKFSKEILGKKILKVWRRAKNVLIDIEDDKTILIHMKMTGHLLFGEYQFQTKSKKWIPKKLKSPLADPFNRFIHFVFELGNGRCIAFSDARKFATIKLINGKDYLEKEFAKHGPEPLEENFKLNTFKKALFKKPDGKIKTVLMDVNIISGIGNIYSDEILWASNIHPERAVKNLSDLDFKNLYKQTKILLSKGINLGGDSMSDYRNPFGLRGEFQNHHNAYKLKGKKCKKKNCQGLIIRKIINTRSAHFCNTHQK
jgi:formamidopyrimidine-DNA glycosylase